MRRSLPTSEERRDLGLSDAGVFLSDATENTQRRFAGHAAVFNTRTSIGDPLTWGFTEEIAPGAFTKTLAESDVRMLIDHDSSKVVSRMSAGSLRLFQDARGLAVDSAMDTELSYVGDLARNLSNGNITGMSFGFRVTRDEWFSETRTVDGQDYETEHRVIREVQLFEVSAVTFPAYEETDAGLRHSVVPALLRRGDDAAIARAAKHRPELAELLGYASTPAPVDETTRESEDDIESTEVPAPDLSTRVARQQRLRELQLAAVRHQLIRLRVA